MTDAQLSLAEQIDRDLKQAMRAGRRCETHVAQRQDRSPKRPSPANSTLSEEDVLAVIQRRPAAARTAQEYERLGAGAGSERAAELAVLEHYLPQQLTAAEIEEIVRNVIAETAPLRREMGRVMSGYGAA